MANDNWSDEECRYFLELYAAEKKKGNKTKVGMNQEGKEFIIAKFEQRFSKGYFIWEKFKNKYDTCRKAYARFRKLTHNRTGLGFDELGRLDMTDHWWNELEKEWPASKKLRLKLPLNMDVINEEFGSVTVTGGEGWSAQQGEASLDSRVDGDDDDEVESVDKEMPIPETQTQAVDTQTQDVETQTQGGASKKRKRKEKNIVVETSVARNKILAQKNKIAEQLLEREYASSVERVLEVLNELPGVRKWSLFHRASVDHLLADAVNRQGFIAFSSDEDKISYLEHRTGTKLYD